MNDPQTSARMTTFILPPCGEGGAKRRMGVCMTRAENSADDTRDNDMITPSAPIRLPRPKAGGATFPARGKDRCETHRT